MRIEGVQVCKPENSSLKSLSLKTSALPVVERRPAGGDPAGAAQGICS
jgi:hypothetical protein